jgi:hypothetical protein
MKFLTKFTLIIMLATLPLAACAGTQVAPPDGQVVAVQIGTTLWGMRSAILEKPGTMIFMRDDLISFWWTLQDGWAFATINWTNKAPVGQFADIAKNGNFINCHDAACLSDVMRNNGWKLIGAREVPAAIRTSLSASSSWLISMAQSMPTFLVIPVDMLHSSDKIIYDYLGVKDG